MADAAPTGLGAVIARQRLTERLKADGIEWSKPGVQLSLIPSDAEEEVADGETAEVMRGPGRPKGAGNKRAEDWSKYILARYPSPLVALAETYCRDVGQLAIELGCTLLEAAKMQMAAAKELAPYVHQRLPQAVELTGSDGVPLMALFVSPDIARLKDMAGGGRVLTGLAMDPEDEEAGEEESEADQ